MGKLRSLLKLKPFLQKYKLLLFFALIGIILGSIVAIPVPYIIGKIMDDVLIGSKSFNEFYFYIGIITILYVLKYFISITSNYLSSKFNNFMSNDLRFILIDKVMDLPMDYLANVEKGYLQGRISECDSITAIFSGTIISILLSTVNAVLSVSTMFVINYKLAIAVLILVPFFFILAKFSNHALTKNTKKMLEDSAILNAECFEIINGVEDIKILNGKAYSLGKFKKKLDQFIKITLKQNKTMLLLSQNVVGVNDVGTLLILLIAGNLIIKGEFTVGLYTTFSLYSSKIFSSTQLLANIGPSLKQACLSIERLYELIDMDDENKGKNKHLNKKIESIKLENVTFKYKNSIKNVLDSLNFEINKGEKVLISGENGTGKSTLIKLLVGLYEPTEGRILYNNLDLATINNESLRSRIGIVSQNMFLFKGTVLDNILYGQNQKKRKDVEKLIIKLNLENYISRLPEGLDSKIIQNNNGISGGQTQVIAFIRAVLSNKDIIILDEPISNVDAETRNIILNILKESKFDGILIIISHFTKGMEFINKTIKVGKK
ncbi:ABC transporter ATP-binding protein [Clostridium botulinum]|uniref:ABC-family secretion protein n=1 Tax=Clostridium botulinum (strain Hall / ATCC 3502 / NCTC 13319 / Type A) TaxID=441771 RepID=A5I839_CLOBH|nr:ABC transporter ATP-binding protein [Clostridium botulinum]NFL70829.1 ABC transporter ATP-binding protein [Clostridium botulinum]NFQ55182.1 ABC transporter ATP-binding protein [Clostridium botulinum]NFT48099.1 ABC transporter ATP-binding protein [Clostridium botulinum]QGT45389.1 putative ABC transporter ATP-binding protein [Clostridium botulinum]CAL81552.1 ABC-family secretion protein [Clostridium botulinum A str. ATCC 3502]